MKFKKYNNQYLINKALVFLFTLIDIKEDISFNDNILNHHNIHVPKNIN